MAVEECDFFFCMQPRNATKDYGTKTSRASPPEQIQVQSLEDWSPSGIWAHNKEDLAQCFRILALDAITGPSTAMYEQNFDCPRAPFCPCKRRSTAFLLGLGLGRLEPQASAMLIRNANVPCDAQTTYTSEAVAYRRTRRCLPDGSPPQARRSKGPCSRRGCRPLKSRRSTVAENSTRGYHVTKCGDYRRDGLYSAIAPGKASGLGPASKSPRNSPYNPYCAVPTGVYD